MARACFYCGEPAEVRDHGIPLWVPSLVGLEGEPVEHLVAREPPPREPEVPGEQLPVSIPRHAELGAAQPDARLTRSIDEAIAERERLELESYAAVLLCAGCAAALAALDERARLLVAPLVEGEAARLGPWEQRTLAAWGARTAYAVLAVERKSRGVPKSHRRVLREGGEPHPNVFVGIGRYRGADIGVLAGRLAVPFGETEVEAYSVLCVFGHLVLKVVGLHRRPARSEIRPSQGEIARVWPDAPDEVTWPPLWSLSAQALEHAFTQMPFYRPFVYSEVRYLGPGQKIPAKRKRTEGLRGRQ
jgi:hypothetical protein